MTPFSCADSAVAPPTAHHSHLRPTAPRPYVRHSSHLRWQRCPPHLPACLHHTRPRPPHPHPRQPHLHPSLSLALLSLHSHRPAVASTAAAAAAAAEATDGPVLSVVSKRLRAPRKKYNRILQTEESLAAGKMLNREQEEVLRSKPVVSELINELEGSSLIWASPGVTFGRNSHDRVEFHPVDSPFSPNFAKRGMDLEVDGKKIQIQLIGFMEKNTVKFTKELWSLLLSVQKNASGVPQQFLDAKEAEIQQKKAEEARIAQEIQKKQERWKRQNWRNTKRWEEEDKKSGRREITTSSKRKRLFLSDHKKSGRREITASSKRKRQREDVVEPQHLEGFLAQNHHVHGGIPQANRLLGEIVTIHAIHLSENGLILLTAEGDHTPYERHRSYFPYERRRSYSPYGRRRSYSPYDRHRSYSPYHVHRYRSRSPYRYRRRRSDSYDHSVSLYYSRRYSSRGRRRGYSRSVSP